MIFLDEIQTTDQLIRAFHAWLETFDAVDDERRLLDLLGQCHEPLPNSLRRDFDLPWGSTYASAADLFLSLWVDIGQDIQDCE